MQAKPDCIRVKQEVNMNDDKNKKIVIFAGTTEGRFLSEGLARAGLSHSVCVATEYGELTMQPHPEVCIKTGRMDESEMEGYFKTHADIVYDATHPYAKEVTKNIRSACEATGTEYIRILRMDAEMKTVSEENISFFENTEECAEALKELSGNILLTTGSKELPVFSDHIDTVDRLFARVLPSEESIRICADAGLPARNIIAMQGPFSKELNKAMIKQFGIVCLVTKQSGMAGGYAEKLEAALEAGIKVYVIGRGEKEEGIGVDDALKPYGIKKDLRISLIGCGPGAEELFTFQAKNEICEADVVFGSARLVENISGKKTYPYYLAKDVIPVLEKADINSACILFSGDSSFFSGAGKMRTELLKWADEKDIDCEINTLPGISSLSYLAAKTGESYQSFPLLSLHGRSDENSLARVAASVKTNEKVFLILSGSEDLKALAASLSGKDEENYSVILGYELSYPEEEITTLSLSDCRKLDKKGLFAAIIKNAAPEKKSLVPFIADDDFERAKVPMTKEMIRHASILRLGLFEGAVLYDVGSGTGSVSIEAALLDPSVTVYAIEKKDSALELTKTNVEKFSAQNVKIVDGEAPDVFAELLPPTHVFIGGSSGRLKDIIDSLRSTDREIRVVINAISLETIAEVSDIAKEDCVSDFMAEQISYSKGRELGAYHLMAAENPVMLFSFVIRPANENR